MTTTVTSFRTTAVANGTAPIPFTFQALSADELEVYRAGVLQTKTTHYTVTLNGDGTGSITPVASWGTDAVEIRSNPNLQQLTNFTRFGPMYPDQLNPPLDRLARTSIALAGQLDLVDARETADISTLSAALTALDNALNERARDAIGAALIGSGGITVTPNDPGDQIVLDASALALTNGVMPVATVADLKAATSHIDGTTRFLFQAGREGLFKWNSANLSTLVAADTLNGVYIPPSSDLTGASGAWVRVFSSALNVKWFGAIADNATDASPAINAAFRVAEKLAITAVVNPSIYRGAPSVYVPEGKYYCASTLEPLATLRLYGDGGLGWGAPTQLRFPVGVTGFRAQAHNTSGANTVDGVAHFAGDALVVEDIYFLGAYATALVETEAHGFHAKRAVHLRRCTFDSFQGDGYYGYANFGGGAPNEGNVNTARIIECQFDNNRSGIFNQGGDANAAAYVACSFIGNRRWGIEDRSFLGNHSFGHHFDANGITSSGDGTAGKPVSLVHRTGNWYAVVDGQEVWAAANAPSGTTADNQGWIWMQAGGASPTGGVPTWFAGINIRSGGPILVSNINSASSFTGCHIESNGVSQLDQGATMFGGAQGYVIHSSAGTISRNRVSTINASSNGLNLGGSTVISGDLSARSPVNTLGPTSGATVTDGLTILASRNVNHVLQCTIYDAIGNPTNNGTISFNQGLGLIYNTQGGAEWHRFRIGGADIASVQPDGFHVTGVGAFSGNVTAPNLQYAVVTRTAGYTETATSGELLIKADLAAGFTIVLPTAVGNKAKFHIKKMQAAGQIVIDGAGSETIDGALTATLNSQYESITLVSDNANWNIL